MTRPRRSWYRFSLRSLLGLTFGCCLASGWWLQGPQVQLIGELNAADVWAIRRAATAHDWLKPGERILVIRVISPNRIEIPDDGPKQIETDCGIWNVLEKTDGVWEVDCCRATICCGT